MKFQKYFTDEVKVEKLDKGITNFNYLTNNGYIIKQYSNFVRNNESEAMELVAEFDTELFLINKEVKITKFIQNARTVGHGEFNKEDTIEMAKILKRFNNKKLKSNVYWDPREVMKEYLSKIKTPLHNYDKYMHLVDAVDKIYPTKENLFFSHNDLNSGNFLFAPDRLYIIDWEYSGMNDPLFDPVCFLTQNAIWDTEYRDIFLNQYFQGEKIPWDTIKVWRNFQTLMWAIWANMMNDKRESEVYVHIAEVMINNVDKWLSE